MFYCDKCSLKNKWPNSLSRSSGRCEVCGEAASCNDVPSSALPLPEKQHSEIADTPMRDWEELDI